MAYDGNEFLRGLGQKIEYTPEIIAEYIRCRDDICYFASKYVHIISIDEGVILIPLRPYQKRVLAKYTIHDKIILMAPRQTGKTVMSFIYILHYAIFNNAKEIAVLANKEPQAKEILDRIKFAYERLPLWMQQGIKEWNKKSILLENDSKIAIGTTGSSAIRGKSISLLYLDEFAHVPRHLIQEFMTAVFPAISSAKTSKIIISSTPKGQNHFYHIWREAEKKLNSYEAIKINYTEVPGRDAAWRAKQIKDHGMRFWQQEYNNSFLGSTSTLIMSETLDKLNFKDPIDVRFDGMLEMYEPVDKSKKYEYIIGIDSSEGVGKNYSVANILKIVNHQKIEQVGVYRNNLISPYLFAQVCIEISKYYNDAMMMIENNNVGSQVANHIWYDFDCDLIVNMENKGLGIRSTKQTKLQALLLLKRYTEDEFLKIKNKKTIEELITFTEKKEGVFGADNNEDTDDCVMSLAWGIFYLTTPYYEGSDELHSISENLRLQEATEKPSDENFGTVIPEDRPNIPEIQTTTYDTNYRSPRNDDIDDSEEGGILLSGDDEDEW